MPTRLPGVDVQTLQKIKKRISATPLKQLLEEFPSLTNQNLARLSFLGLGEHKVLIRTQDTLRFLIQNGYFRSQEELANLALQVRESEGLVAGDSEKVMVFHRLAVWLRSTSFQSNCLKAFEDLERLPTSFRLRIWRPA